LSQVAENTFRFYAPEPALLTLSVSIIEPNVDIHVFHHHKPHVYIHLTRSDELSNTHIDNSTSVILPEAKVSITNTASTSSATNI